jgi:hypothetical protein
MKAGSGDFLCVCRSGGGRRKATEIKITSSPAPLQFRRVSAGFWRGSPTM